MVATAIASNAVLAAAGDNFRSLSSCAHFVADPFGNPSRTTKKDRQKTFRCLSLLKSLLASIARVSAAPPLMQAALVGQHQVGNLLA